MHTLSRRAALAGLAFFALWPGPADAQEPTLKIIFPFSAGSSADAVARMLADHLQKSLARPVIVENRPGAGGRIALRAVKEAAPDGATLLFATAGLFTLYPHVYANLGYNPLVDLLPIIQVVKFDQALAVSGKLPVRSLPELVAWLWAPAGTPSTVAERLRAAIADALNNGEIRTRIETLGFEIAGTTGEALVQILRAEHDRWGPIVKASGFKADQ